MAVYITYIEDPKSWFRVLVDEATRTLLDKPNGLRDGSLVRDLLATVVGLLWCRWVVNPIQDRGHADATLRHQPLHQILVLRPSYPLKILERIISRLVIVLPDKGAVEFIHGAGPLLGAQEVGELGGRARPGVVSLVLVWVADGPVASRRLPHVEGHVDHVVEIGLGVVVEAVLDVFLFVQSIEIKEYKHGFRTS